MLQGVLNLQIIPEFAQGFSQLRAARLALVPGEMRSEIFKRRQNFLTQLFKGFGQPRIIGDLKRFAPLRAVPAARERLVFEPVNFRLVHGQKPGLERGEPIIMQPFQRDGAEGAAGQFGKRVMDNGFAPVEEKRNFVAAKHACQRFVIIVEISHQHGGVAKTSAAANEAQNLARGKRGLGLGICTNGQGDCRLPIADCRFFRFAAWRLRPILLQVQQRCIPRKPVFPRVAFEQFDCDFAIRQIFRSQPALLIRFGDRRPDRKPGMPDIGCRLGFEAKREGRTVAVRQKGGEQIQFLRGHFGKAIEPQAGNCQLRIVDCRF